MGSFARDCLLRCGWSAEGSSGLVQELYFKSVQSVTPGPERSRTEEGESKIQDPGYFPRARTFCQLILSQFVPSDLTGRWEGNSNPISLSFSPISETTPHSSNPKYASGQSIHTYHPYQLRAGWSRGELDRRYSKGLMLACLLVLVVVAGVEGSQDNEGTAVSSCQTL